MKIEFLPGQNFECTACARCCRGWTVHVDPATVERMRDAQVARDVSDELGRPALEPGEEGTVTASRDGGCVFLDAQSLCRIHGAMGSTAKPLGCRQFPFLIRPTPDGVVVGISFFCTSARENRGRPLETYEDEIRALVSEWGFRPVGEEPIPVHQDRSIVWPEYLLLERLLVEGLEAKPPMLAVGGPLLGVCRWLRGAGGWFQVLPEAAAAEFPRDQVLASMEGFFLASLVGILEAGKDEARALTEALLSGGRIRLPRYSWEGPAGDIAAFAATTPRPEWLDGEVARYLKALLFVKFPAMNRPLLDNLSLLYLLPPLLRWYATAAALARGAPAVETEDFHRALEVAERELVTHGRGLDRLYAAFGQAFLDEVQTRNLPP